jgi:hypothetical protein
VLLVRDPHDWVLARARFFMSDNFQGNVDFIKDGSLSIDDLLSLMIFGIHGKAPPMADIYRFNAAAWLGSDIHVIQFEQLVRQCADLGSDEAEAFFTALLGACGIAVPGDWRDRVRIGSDRKQSGTARENLAGQTLSLPDSLPAKHRRLVDFAAPGLRSLLGYAP